MGKTYLKKSSVAGLFMLPLLALLLLVSTGIEAAGATETYATMISEDSPSPFRRVAEKVVPAVVSIDVTRDIDVSMQDSPFFDQFREFFKGREMPENHAPIPGSGSGFIIDPTGIVVTNNHVIRDTQSIKIRFPGERDAYEAEVLGTDPRTDLAVLRITDGEGRVFPFVEQGDSDVARVGDWAIAIGNPLGQLEGSLTVGVISAKGRTNLAIQGGAPDYQDFIQTDAAINFGNSGGPLVDINGRVIGINTAINASGQGIGFAIPISLASKIIPQLIDSGRVARAYLGVIPRELSADFAEALGIEIERGILIEDVVTGAPADKAGINEGDVITEFDGKSVDEVDRFRFMVAEKQAGEQVQVRLYRDGKTMTKKVNLVEFPDAEEMAMGGGESGIDESDWFGIEVEALAGSEIAESLELDTDEGVVVTRIRSGSPADQAELRVGDVIQKIKNHSVKDMDDFNDAVAELEGSTKRIGLLVQRQAYSTFLFLTPE